MSSVATEDMSSVAEAAAFPGVMEDMTSVVAESTFSVATEGMSSVPSQEAPSSAAHVFCLSRSRGECGAADDERTNRNT